LMAFHRRGIPFHYDAHELSLIDGRARGCGRAGSHARSRDTA
jgi:hypothetical protein